MTLFAIQSAFLDGLRMDKTNVNALVQSIERSLHLGPVYMEWGAPVYWGWFLVFSRSEGHKTKETSPTRPGSPTPSKQGLNIQKISFKKVNAFAFLVKKCDNEASRAVYFRKIREKKLSEILSW